MNGKDGWMDRWTKRPIVMLPWWISKTQASNLLILLRAQYTVASEVHNCWVHVITEISKCFSAPFYQKGALLGSCSGLSKRDHHTGFGLNRHNLWRLGLHKSLPMVEMTVSVLQRYLSHTARS